MNRNYFFVFVFLFSNSSVNILAMDTHCIPMTLRIFNESDSDMEIISGSYTCPTVKANLAFRLGHTHRTELDFTSNQQLLIEVSDASFNVYCPKELSATLCAFGHLFDSKNPEKTEETPMAKIKFSLTEKSIIELRVLKNKVQFTPARKPNELPVVIDSGLNNQ